MASAAAASFPCPTPPRSARPFRSAAQSRQGTRRWRYPVRTTTRPVPFRQQRGKTRVQLLHWHLETASPAQTCPTPKPTPILSMACSRHRRARSALVAGAVNVRVEWTSRGVCRVKFVRQRPQGRLPYHLQEQLDRYFAGQPVRFRVPLDLRAGTSFQQKVWQALRRIPYGQTRSYAWVARQIGSPKAVRAVGAACGANPVPILIPCHRVVRSDGSLGGFSGGLARKRALLRLENAGTPPKPSA